MRNLISRAIDQVRSGVSGERESFSLVSLIANAQAGGVLRGEPCRLCFYDAARGPDAGCSRQPGTPAGRGGQSSAEPSSSRARTPQ